MNRIRWYAYGILSLILSVFFVACRSERFDDEVNFIEKEGKRGYVTLSVPGLKNSLRNTDRLNTQFNEMKYIDFLFYDAEDKMLIAREHFDLEDVDQDGFQRTVPIYKQDMYVVAVVNAPINMLGKMAKGASLEELQAPIKVNRIRPELSGYFDFTNKYRFVPMCNAQGPVLLKSEDLADDYKVAEEKPLNIEVEILTSVVFADFSELKLTESFFEPVKKPQLYNCEINVNATHYYLMRPLAKLAGNEIDEVYGDGSEPKDRYASYPFESEEEAPYKGLPTIIFKKENYVLKEQEDTSCEILAFETVPNTDVPQKNNSPGVVIGLVMYPTKYKSCLDNIKDLKYSDYGYAIYSTADGEKFICQQELLDSIEKVKKKEKLQDSSLEEIINKLLETKSIKIKNNDILSKYGDSESYKGQGFDLFGLRYYCYGINYYTYYPSHFTKEQRKGSIYGRFGLVRNNIYILNIKKISRIGDPCPEWVMDNDEELKAKDSYNSICIEQLPNNIHESDVYF